MSRRVVLVDAVRTPFGKSGGAFVNTRADALLIRAQTGDLGREIEVFGLNGNALDHRLTLQ